MLATKEILAIATELGKPRQSTDRADNPTPETSARQTVAAQSNNRNLRSAIVKKELVTAIHMRSSKAIRSVL